MRPTKQYSRIVSHKEIRSYCKRHKISKEDAIREALLKNPPKFHKQAIETINQIFRS